MLGIPFVIHIERIGTELCCTKCAHSVRECVWELNKAFGIENKVHTEEWCDRLSGVLRSIADKQKNRDNLQPRSLGEAYLTEIKTALSHLPFEYRLIGGSVVSSSYEDDERMIEIRYDVQDITAIHALCTNKHSYNVADDLYFSTIDDLVIWINGILNDKYGNYAKPNKLHTLFNTNNVNNEQRVLILESMIRELSARTYELEQYVCNHIDTYHRFDS
ncbi:hypothetical protein [Scytonema sp. NUACC26]|uniref:hypothetical protein n=1 Tax=Scytonema sp. NUACC26 TaxID=3140176 RepID=UPI0038B2FAA7